MLGFTSHGIGHVVICCQEKGGREDDPDKVSTW